MDDESQLILHVGLPKGGSSALQTALSLSPDLTTASGRRLRYSALHQSGGRRRLLQGDPLRQAAMRSPYGYVTWPNVGVGAEQAEVFAALDNLRHEGLNGDHLPIVSNEGWIHQPELFESYLKSWGFPPVDLVAFLRPPVDWVNAAYWQWGVWHAPNLGTWLTRGREKYRFGLDLERWSQIPNVRLRLAGFRPDVVGKFASRYQVTLPDSAPSNSASSPALIGFLLRNRRFRPSGHVPMTEFVFQRWCPPVPGRRLWTIRWKHLNDLRKSVQRNLEALERIATAEEFSDICADPRWQDEEVYHAEIERGASDLEDREQLAALYRSLCEGVRRASEAGDLAVKPPPGCPAESAGLDVWDEALVPLVEMLLVADEAARGKAVRRRTGQELRMQGRKFLSRLLE